MQEKKQEVELRVLLEPEQRADLEAKLKAYGIQWEATENIVDEYYCPQRVGSFAEITMDEVGSFSLRSRMVERGGVMQVQLNTKVITTQGDHHAWEEHEVSVDSAPQLQAILGTLGYKVFCRIEKERTIFKLGQKTICIDEIRDFGCALEIEVMTCPDAAQEAKREIEQFLASLGVSREQILPKSVTYLIMQTRSARF